MVLCAHLYAGCSLEQNDGGVGDVECSKCCACEVITARAVDEVDFLAVPLYVAYGREYRITVLMLYGEVVADCCVQTYSAAALDDAGLVEHSFSQGRFARTVIA